MSEAPVLTPSSVVAGKEHVVVVEFPSTLPSAGLITLAFYEENSSVQLGSNVPAARLGPKTLKAHFPKFSRPGVVDTSVQVMREQQPLFPRFPVLVQSPLEAMFSALCRDKGEDRVTDNSLAVLASLLAYISNSEEEQHGTGDTDRLLCKALHSVSPDRLADWHFGPFLSGRFGWDESLLHVCARQKLEETALLLLQPHYVEGKVFFLLKKAPYDNKTPQEIARKNGMKRMAGLAEMLTGGHKTPSTPKDKRRRRSISRSSSIDTNLHLSTQEGEVPASPSSSKKKEKGANKLKKLFGKEKESKTKTPSHQAAGASAVVGASESHEDQVSIASNGSPQISSSLPRSTPPVTDVKRTSISRDQPLPLPQSHPSDQPLPLPQSLPRDLRQSMTSSLSSSEEVRGTGSRVSSKEYDSSLPPRDVIRPMSGGVSPRLSLSKEHKTTEYDDDNIYKVPKNVIRIEDSNSEDEDIYKVPRSLPRPLDDEEDIYKVPRNITRPLDDEEDIYKVPRNIPRPLDCNSDEEEDIYKIPKNIPLNGPEMTDSPDHDLYNIPRNVRVDSPSVRESPEHDLYNIPRKQATSAVPVVSEDDDDDDDSDHLYEKVPEEMLSEMRLNSMLHSLPEGHYMKVPTKKFLHKHSEGSAGSTGEGKMGTGSSFLDNLMKKASNAQPRKDALIHEKELGNNEDDEEEEDDDGYDYPPVSSTLDRMVISLGQSSVLLSKDNMMQRPPFSGDTLHYHDDKQEEEIIEENIYDEPADLFQRYNIPRKQDETSGIYDDVANSLVEKQTSSQQHKPEITSATKSDSESEEQKEFAKKVSSKKTHYQKITFIAPKKDKDGKVVQSQSSAGQLTSSQPAAVHIAPPPPPPPPHDSPSPEPSPSPPEETTPLPPFTPASIVETTPLSPCTPVSMVEIIPLPPHTPASMVEITPLPPHTPASMVEITPLPPRTPASKVEITPLPPRTPASMVEITPLPPRTPASMVEITPLPPRTRASIVFPPPPPLEPQISIPTNKKTPPSPPIPEKTPPSPPIPAKTPSSPLIPAKAPPSPPLPAKTPPSPPLPARTPPSPPRPAKTAPSPPPVVRTPPPSPLPAVAAPPPSEMFNTLRNTRSATLSQTGEVPVMPSPPSPTKRPRTNTSFLHSATTTTDHATSKQVQPPVPKPRKTKTETLPASFATKPPVDPSSPKFRTTGRNLTRDKMDSALTMEQKIAAFAATPPHSPSLATKKKPPVATPPTKSKFRDAEDNQMLIKLNRKTSSPVPAKEEELPQVLRRSTMLPSTKANNTSLSSTPEVGPKPRRTTNIALEQREPRAENSVHQLSPVIGSRLAALGPKIPVSGPKIPIPASKPMQAPILGPKPNQSPIPGPKPQRSRNLTQDGRRNS